MQLFADSAKKYSYPYSPNAGWRIAVSRRFNHPYVDRLYYDCVMPVLQTEGYVLECKFAAETAEEYNFWMNKFSLILEVSDIHVLIDIERSANMEFEFQRSKFITKNAITPSLTTNFGWTITSSKTWVRPIRIYLTKGVSNRSSIIKRERVINMSNRSCSEISNQLSKAIRWAKRLRLIDLHCALKIYEKPMVLLNEADVEIKPALIKMTELAKLIIEDAPFSKITQAATDFELRYTIEDIKSDLPSLESAIGLKLNDHYRAPIRLFNEYKERQLEFYKGDIELPRSFFERVTYMKNLYRENMKTFLDRSKLFSKDLLDTFVMKAFIQLAAIFGAINLSIYQKYNKNKH